eukprot:CAMPEP_0170555798 /NCGR_PEP_ID=MMETSP0211-20121228/13611_1 /TAXON_ID=311385 /ORGANISM="Pseudokeronopsis sp., Strain OXSARD2" /LENGTH=71 /DNA_ID=CAMNT_0010865787 /DNA_START=1120 /DNA_END=1332 /DNA_ORIENTATION=+
MAFLEEKCAQLERNFSELAKLKQQDEINNEKELKLLERKQKEVLTAIYNKFRVMKTKYFSLDLKYQESMML